MIANYIKASILVTLLVCAGCLAQAQKQLVLLNRERVIMRFNPGDEITISIRGEKQRLTSYVNNLFDTALVLHNTVVPLHKIDRVYFSHTGLVNLVGKFLVVAGVAYFVIDQFNVIVVNGEDPSLNDDVTTASVAMVAAGLPMMLIKKKSQKLGGKYRLMTVSEGSPFYLEPANSDFPDP